MLQLNKKVISLLLFLLLLLSSCNIGPGNKEKEQKATGGISLQLPAKINLDIPVVESSSRAYIFTERVVVTIKEGDTVVDEVVLYQELGNFNGIYEDINIGAGTYSLEVEVFNDTVSETVAILSGSATGIVVQDGFFTEATVLLTPLNPTTITLGNEVAVGEVAATDLDIIVSDYDDFKMDYTPGGEKWYTFTATGDYTKIDFANDSLNMYYLFVLFSAQEEITTFGNDLVFKTVADAVYYIGVVKANYGANYLELVGEETGEDFTRTFTVTNVTLESDNNEDQLAAEELTVGTEKTFTYNREYDQDFFYVDLTANQSYLFYYMGELDFQYTTSDSGSEYHGSDFMDYYTPSSDERVYFQVDFDDYFSNPGLVDTFIVKEADTIPVVLEFSIWYLDYMNPDIISIDYRLIRRDIDGNISDIEGAAGEVPFLEDSDVFEIDLGIIDDWSTVEILIGYNETSGGQYVGGETGPLSDYVGKINDLEGLNKLDFYTDEIKNAYINMESYVYYQMDYFNGVQYIYGDTPDPTMTYLVTEVPSGSTITDDSITVPNDGQYFTFTPDVEGTYKIEGHFTDGYVNGSVAFIIEAHGETDGGVYVDFE